VVHRLKCDCRTSKLTAGISLNLNININLLPANTEAVLWLIALLAESHIGVNNL
jgi:hypothetical protein